MNAWKITLRKTLRAALGLLVCSIGSYCTIVADVGLAPWDALFMGVSEHLPVSDGLRHLRPDRRGGRPADA